jgi:hypothetical protein
MEKKDEGYVVVEVIDVVVTEVPEARDEQRSASPTVGWSRALDANWDRTFGARKELN